MIKKIPKDEKKQEKNDKKDEAKTLEYKKKKTEE